jgi:hypothetical protein
MGKTDIQINETEVILSVANLTPEQISDIKSVINYQEEIPDENNPIIEEQIINGEPTQVTVGFNMKPNDVPWHAEWMKSMVETFEFSLNAQVRSKMFADAEAEITERTKLI